MTKSGTVPGVIHERLTLVGAFDDTSHAERARRDLAAAGFAPEQVAGVTGAGPTPAAAGADTPGHVREAALGGAFLGVVAGALLGVGAVALPGLGPLGEAGSAAVAAACAALGAATGAFLGRPVAARAARADSLLLQVGAGEDRDAARASALLARAGATRTWAYQPPGTAAADSGREPGRQRGVEDRQE